MKRQFRLATRLIKNLDLTDPAFDAVYEFQARVHPEGTPQDAVRDLLRMATASETRLAAFIAGRHTAYREASRMVRTDLAESLRKTREKLLAANALDLGFDAEENAS